MSLFQVWGEVGWSCGWDQVWGLVCYDECVFWRKNKTWVNKRFKWIGYGPICFILWSKSEGIPLLWYQWLSARMQYLQCISNGDTAVLHLTIDTRWQSMVCCTPYWIWWKPFHDDVTIWKSFLHYWLFWRGIHQSVIHFHHKWPLMWSFDTSFAISLNTLLNKQSNGQ